MQASIFHPLQTEHMSCTVRDISQDGALVEFPYTKDLPSLFWLRLCTIAWHGERKLGVEFSEQIMERRRSERWTQARAAWSKPRPPRQSPVFEASSPAPVRWSASMVCLRAS